MKFKINNTTAGVCFTLTGIIVLMLYTSCRKNGTHASSIANNDSTISVNINNDSVSFMVIGDWGRDGNQHQKTVADQMDVFARKYHIDFIVTTGDNFYPAGVASIDDAH
ncbi:MAG: hypothetical protein ICV66_13100, partial [Chitinophagaceae bacterium]|nr:hypothetical protein [Chitinophagaceae bacterium]